MLFVRIFCGIEIFLDDIFLFLFVDFFRRDEFMLFLLLLFKLFNVFFNLSRFNLVFVFLEFLLLKFKLIRFVLIEDLWFFVFEGVVDKFLFDFVEVGDNVFLYFRVFVLFDCFWWFFERVFVVLLDVFFLLEVDWKLNNVWGFFLICGFGDGVGLFFLSGFNLNISELGCEFEDFFEFWRMMLDVFFGDEFNCLLSCDRLFKMVFFVGFIGFGFV